MKKNNLCIIILSMFLALIITIGNSFLITDSLILLYKSIFHVIGAVIFYIIIYFMFKIFFTYLFSKFDVYKGLKDKQTNNWFIKQFDKHPFLFSLIIIIICWLPYIISFYPIILSPDPSFQIKQFLGIPNKYSDYVVLLDESQIITNHHPVIHTMLLGSFVKLGININNANFGLFLYSILQITFLSMVLSSTIKFLKKHNISIKYRLICLIIYSLVPMFPLYAMSGVKDVYFGGLIILYTMSLYTIIKNNKIKILDSLFLVILMLFIFLFRNNGIHVMILSFPFVLWFKRRHIWPYLLIFIFVISSYTIYDKVILQAFKITPTSIRETLSIPFQQTARYVLENEEIIDDFEYRSIDKVLTYDTLKDRYNSEKSDPVKNEYNRYATSDDLKNYFKAWGIGLFKAPLTYTEATISNTYGYFYPLKTNWYIYYKKDNRINEDGIDYHYNKLNISRSILGGYGIVFPYLPVIGLISNIAINVWFLLIMALYLIKRKLYQNITYLIPSLVLLLVCIASPVNCYFRYALPFVFAMPLLIGFFFSTLKNDKKK